MAFRHSYYVAGLALFWGGCGCGLMVPWAVAGDRIEFSAPPVGWTVPQREIEQKDKDNGPGNGPHFSSYQSSDILPVYQETTVVVSRSREMDKHAWDSHRYDSRLSLTPDEDKKKQTVLEELLGPEIGASEASETTSPTSPTSGRSDRGFGFSNDSRSKKEQEKTETSNDQLHSENLALFGQERDRKEEPYSDRYGQSLDSVPWMKGSQDRDEVEQQDRAFHLDLEKMHRGDYVPLSSEKNPFETSEAASGFDVAGSSQDPLHAPSALPSTSTAYSSLPSSLSGANAGEAFSPGAMSSAWAADTMPAPSAYISPAPVQPAWSAAVPNFGAPATLPFPHRPGSPFQ
ncbi:MAG: hypothetical protein ACLQVY_25420 [Limisphaerales bacterium]